MKPGAPRTGQDFLCLRCNKSFYRSPAQSKNSPKYCSVECKRMAFKGSDNPFWGKSHSNETKKKISESRKGKAIGNQNAKNYKHTDLSLKKIGEASKRLWQDHRGKMMDCKPRGEKHHFHKPPELRRHRKEFTPYERREWTNTECSFCGSKKNLELDHIIPIFDGGINLKENAQTLCRGCNLFKCYKMDLPRYHAALAIKGDKNSSIMS